MTIRGEAGPAAGEAWPTSCVSPNQIRVSRPVMSVDRSADLGLTVSCDHVCITAGFPTTVSLTCIWLVSATKRGGLDPGSILGFRG